MISPQPKAVQRHVGSARIWRGRGRSLSPHPLYRGSQALVMSPWGFCRYYKIILFVNITSIHLLQIQTENEICVELLTSTDNLHIKK